MTVEELVEALLKLRRGAVLAEERDEDLNAYWVIITVDEALKVKDRV